MTSPTSPLAGPTFINSSAIPAPPENGGPVPPELSPQQPPSAPPLGAVPEKSASKRKEKRNIAPGLLALRWFYAQLLLASSQMRVYLPDDAPVPDGIPDALLKKLEFRPVGLDQKRMLLHRSCEALGFRANPRTNEMRLREMRALFGWEELLASGLWQEADHKRQKLRRPNPQYYGHGQVGKKPKELRRDENDKWQWGWCEPVLIPYFNEAGELVKLRPHKGGAAAGTAAGSERIYVPRDHRTVAEQPEKFSTVIICEGEFKAAVIWQCVGAGAGLHGDGQPPVGVCALPGISFARNPKYRADLEEWLRQVDCQRVLVAFDDEDKSHKPLRQRFDSVIYALYLAQWLNLDVGIPAQFIKLPEEWRVKGKADWDGGLVKLRDEKRAREAAGGVEQIFSPITESELQDCRTAIEAVMDSAIWPSQVRQLGLFTEEEEQFIFQEVDRKLWQPKLPNAGPKEREDMRRLWSLSRDESLVVILKAAAGRYADALARCLPRQECNRKGEKWVTLPGCYYKRRPVTGKTDKALFTAAHGTAGGSDRRKGPGEEMVGAIHPGRAGGGGEQFQDGLPVLAARTGRQGDAAGAVNEYQRRGQPGRPDWRRGYLAQRDGFGGGEVPGVCTGGGQFHLGLRGRCGQHGVATSAIGRDGGGGVSRSEAD